MLYTFSVMATERLVCFGDSVTLGRGVSPNECYCSIVGKTLRMEVINSGIGGNNTRQGVERFRKDVLSHKPTTVIIMYGLNDSYVEESTAEPRIALDEYVRNITLMIQRLKFRSVKIVLATPNCTANAWENSDLKLYVQAVRKLAKRHNLLLADIYALTAQMQVEGANLYSDRVHPNAMTQASIADEILKQLRKQRDQQCSNSMLQK